MTAEIVAIASQLQSEPMPAQRIKILKTIMGVASRTMIEERRRLNLRKRVGKDGIDPNAPRFATEGMRQAYETCLAAWNECGHAVNDDWFVGTGRASIVPARYAWVVLCREMGFSYPEIARSMNRKNHSTAVTAVEAIQTGRSVAAEQSRGLLAIARRAVIRAGLYPSGGSGDSLGMVIEPARGRKEAV